MYNVVITKHHESKLFSSSAQVPVDKPHLIPTSRQGGIYPFKQLACVVEKGYLPDIRSHFAHHLSLWNSLLLTM